MVFPTITINSVVHDIEHIEYKDGKPSLVTVQIDGEKAYFWDKSSSFNADAFDLNESIVWQGRHDPVNQAFDNLISNYEDELIIISKLIARLYVERSAIHPSLVEKYDDLKQLIRATAEAKNALSLIL